MHSNSQFSQQMTSLKVLLCVCVCGWKTGVHGADHDWDVFWVLAVELSAAGVVLRSVCLRLLEGRKNHRHTSDPLHSTSPKIHVIVAVVGEFLGEHGFALLTAFSPSDVSPPGARGSGRSGCRSSVWHWKRQRKRFRLRIYLQRQVNLILMSRYLLLMNFKVLK